LREVVSLLAPGSLSSARDDRQIFVAYPYRLYPSADYRRVYRDLENPFGVKFVFADERITSLHVLQKIAAFIRSSRFGIYDISGWNPNVTLELGLALGLNESTYLAADPSKTDMHEVPADLRRVDRIQYSSYTELGEGLERLLGQEIPVPRTHEAEDQLQALRNETVRIVSENEGLPIGDIARLLRVSIGLAQVVVRPLVGTQLRTEGTRRWTKYFPA